MKAIKIALLYWLQQTLRLTCPHRTDDFGSRQNSAEVCPNCALWQWAANKLTDLCGWRAHAQLRKEREQQRNTCDLCSKPLPFGMAGVHSDCADAENHLSSI